jgi:signal transduction histidine kinase
MALFWRSHKIDVAVAALFIAITQYEIWIGPSPILNEPVVGNRPVLSLMALGFTLPLAFMRALPIPSLVVVMGLWALPPPPGYSLNLFALFLAVVLAVYLAATSTSGRTAIAAAVIVVVSQIGSDSRALAAGNLSAHFGEWVFFALAWVLGKTVRHRELRGDRLEARTAELEEQRESQIQSAIADERARIARELHDIVAHSVSLMVLQAGAARQALERQPEKARAPLLSVEATGRTAMSELRRLVAMLRQPGEEDELAPQPSLSHVDLLVNQMREAGLMVELDSRGSFETIPPGVDLSAYRIAQEALTNALKHSGATHVDLRVRSDAEAVEVTVEDDGRGSSSNGALVGGHGLIGMRERVNLFGGRFEAGSREEGGFRVYARLPYEPL